MARESSIRFCAARAVEMLRYRLRGETIPRLCDARGVDWFATTDINASHCTDRLRKFAPDLIVSLYTMQLYRRPILDIPPLGTINAHPSLLPDYRGLEVFFWQMANGETHSGVSVFYVGEGIDHGEVLRQRSVPIASSDSMEDVYNNVTEAAAELLCDTAGEIDEKGSATVLKVVGKGPYYPMPTRDAMRRFRRRGRRLR